MQTRLPNYEGLDSAVAVRRRLAGNGFGVQISDRDLAPNRQERLA